MRFSHCTWAVIGLLAVPLGAQTPQPRAATTTGYVIFFRGTPIGREDVSVRTDAAGTTITSQGRSRAPLNTVWQHVEFRYDPAWSPELLVLDGFVNDSPALMRSSFKNGLATTQSLSEGKTSSTTQSVSQNSLMVPAGVFASFAAVAPRLQTTKVGEQLHFFLVPGAEATARLTMAANERMQTGATFFDVRRYDLVVSEPKGTTQLSVTTTQDGSLLRISFPQQALEILREDVAGANTRTSVHSNPGDQQVQIPALGFHLAGTITVPSQTGPAGSAKFPAVVLISDREAPDRDAIATGVPVMSQLAGALASSGFMVVRYDNRSTGQSGGRTESATISDYAEDARAVVKWLGSRKDVDDERIAVVGYDEGAWIALVAAAREKRIEAIVTLAGAGSNGQELILEQQGLQLDDMKIGDEERAKREALQKQIHAAVLTGKGWDQLPPEMRRRADTAWFRSLLAYDPGTVMDDFDAPMLIVHGELDREVPVAHAERLAALARSGDSESVALVTVRGVNHLLIPAVTGTVAEYATLTDRVVSTDVTTTVVDWLTKTLPAPSKR